MSSSAHTELNHSKTSCPKAEQSCSGCGLQHQCVCSLVPSLNVHTHLVLLTHENELERDTNTGRWLQKSLPNCSIHRWARTHIPESLTSLLENPKFITYLLFPSEVSLGVSTAMRESQGTNRTPVFIVLDGTWQEAKKMIRKSSWLKHLPQLHLSPSEHSQYTLRKNQNEGHLCTLEVGAELLKELGETHEAEQLTAFLEQFIPIFNADKSGHALKYK